MGDLPTTPHPEQQPPPNGLMLAVTSLTHHGGVRAVNEDTVAAASFVRTGTMLAPARLITALTDSLICLVADGMGGHTSGNIASAHVAQRLSEVAPFLKDEGALRDAIEAVNDEVFDRMEREPALRGMGSTVAGVLLTPERALNFNVGDSRVYRVDTEYLVQLSTDDNPGSARIDEFGRPAGSSTHLVTQAIGGADQRVRIAPHVGSVPVSADDAWLICSDGLSATVPIERLEEAVRLPDVDAVRQMFRLAMDAGGPDNISIVLARVVAP